MVGPKGYLSYGSWPLFQFHGYMSLIYLTMGLTWIIWSVKHWKKLRKIQHCIAALISLGRFDIEIDKVCIKQLGSPFSCTLEVCLCIAWWQIYAVWWHIISILKCAREGCQVAWCTFFISMSAGSLCCVCMLDRILESIMASEKRSIFTFNPLHVVCGTGFMRGVKKRGKNSALKLSH